MPPVTAPAAALVCPYCHQPILPAYYFCPNCGTKLSTGELSTTQFTQAWIYLFSAILPLMGFIFITRWPGLKYYRSAEPKAKIVGTIAFGIIIISTIITIWLAYVWTQNEIQATINGLNADTSANGD